jgi:hypothetical protein
MAPVIRIPHSAYSATGPPPAFTLDVGAGVPFSVDLSIDPILFNGANRLRRSERNFFSSYTGTNQIPPFTLPASTERIAYVLPQATWNLLRPASVLYYRLIWFDETGAVIRASLDDLDYERAPFIVIVGEIRAREVAFRRLRNRSLGRIQRS